jgi:hypothetical protein
MHAVDVAVHGKLQIILRLVPLLRRSHRSEQLINLVL